MGKNEHLIVITFEPLKVSEPFIDWPWHITIVPWFSVEESRAAELDELLREISLRHSAFNIKISGLIFLGKNKDLPASKVLPSAGLQKLHEDVYLTLETSGFHIHQNSFLGQNYLPHITKQKGKAPKPGDMLIKSISLIKQERLKVTGKMVKQLAKEYPLNG